MRILVVNYRDRHHPQAGGAEVHLHRIFGRLVALGHPVCLLTTSFPGAPAREILDGIEVVRAGGDLAFQWTVLRRLSRLEQEFRPDVIVEDLNKLPVFVNFLTKTPKLIQIHHLWGFSIFRETAFPVAFGVWLAEKLIPLCYRGCAFVAVSPSTVQELAHLGVARERTSLVYNGTEEDYANLEVLREKKPYFLWLGRIRRYKGIWVALEAFRIYAANHSEGELWVAGGGPEEAKLREKVQAWGLQDRVRVLGRVSRDAKRDLMRGALALLQTSFKEGWGLTVIEAAACGTTTVASRVPGLQDSVRDLETGLLFPAGDVRACAAHMETIARNPALRTQLEVAAHRFARSFSWDRAARETLEVLQKVVGEKG